MICFTQTPKKSAPTAIFWNKYTKTTKKTYLKDTDMVFGVQLLEDYRKKGHLILVVKLTQLV